MKSGGVLVVFIEAMHLSVNKYPRGGKYQQEGDQEEQSRESRDGGPKHHSDRKMQKVAENYKRKKYRKWEKILLVLVLGYVTFKKLSFGRRSFRGRVGGKKSVNYFVLKFG